MNFYSPKWEDEYWLGEPIYEENRSVGFHRMWYLDCLNSDSKFNVSLQSRDGQFTKRVSYDDLEYDKKLRAYIIHRTLLNNEIVLDFDAPTYEKNVYNFRSVFHILNKRGYVPYIWYSGNKGLHMHFFMDYSILKDELDMKLQTAIVEHFGKKERFIKQFTRYVAKSLEWIYDNFSIDGQLNHTNHLIRAEGSLHKVGFKTFLGHHPDDVSLIPVILRPEDKTYPKFPFHHYCYTDAEIKKSTPINVVELCKEFLKSKKIGQPKIVYASLTDFFPKSKAKAKDKECVKFLLSSDYAKIGEGRKRALFILASHFYETDNQLERLREWNRDILGNYLPELLIQTTAKSTTGKVGCKYTHEFLGSIGCSNVCKGCSR